MPVEIAMKVLPPERIVCAILAEQVASLPAKIDVMPAFDLLWRTTSLLTWLSGLLTDVSQPGAPDKVALSPAAEHECREAIAEIAQVRQQLDEVAFLQAQKLDYARQVGECLVTALTRMAGEGRFSSGDLAALYVSDDQRQMHGHVIQRLNAAAEPAA